MSFKDLTTHIDTKLEYTNQADFIKQGTENKNSKSGRPKKEDREKRKHKIVIYLTNEEMQSIKEKIPSDNISLYVREIVLHSIKNIQKPNTQHTIQHTQPQILPYV